MTAGRPHVALAVTALHGVSGGAERVMVDVANGLHRRGFPVSVFTYQTHNGPSFYPLDYGIARLDGRRKHSSGRSGSSLGGLTSLTRRNRLAATGVWIAQYAPKILAFRRLLRTARPDVAIGFLPSSFPYLELAATGLSIPVVSSLHNVPLRDLGGDPDRWDQNPVDIWARRRALRRSAANTVLLESFLDQLEPAARSRTHVVPNPIAPATLPPADVTTGPIDNTLLSVGRLSPAKDHATLLRAWARLERQHPTWSLRIVGDGLLYHELIELVAELGLERASIESSRPDIETVYSQAKILAMPSRYEGFGLVTAEAMAHGLPVVGFADCDGTNEIVVDDVNGVLVDSGADRIAALADELSALMTDQSRRQRLASAGPGSVRSFHPDQVIDLWDEIIVDVARSATSS
ncbi:MAG: glycosyltransferase [Actinomycetota bacterium]